jgi:hypothetical protein
MMTKEKRENEYMYSQSPEVVNSNLVTYNNGSEIVFHETAKTAQFTRTDNLFFSRYCIRNSL